MRLRICADTSVLGGCEDGEFREPSLRLLEGFVSGKMIPVLSELTLRELETAPETVRAVLSRVPEENIEPLPGGSHSTGGSWR